MKLLPIFLAFAIVFGACSTAMHIDSKLATDADVYPVKGRQGWMLNQRLSFGTYQSGKVRRGWTKSYDIPFVVRFQGAKEKLSFTLEDKNDAGRTAEVFALGKIEAQDAQILRGLFRIPLKNEDVFTAGIHLPKTNDTWQLVVNNPNKRLLTDVSSGVLEHGQETIQIEEVRHMDNGQRIIGAMVIGYNFVEEGKVIAAVETLNKGRIVLKTDLDADKRLALAAASSALLLRSEIGDQVDN